MASLVSVHNDGPDAVEIRFGPSSRLLQPGQDLRVATTHRVDVVAIAPISREEMDLHMGIRRDRQQEMGRSVDGE
jgi:hypothetical protein